MFEFNFSSEKTFGKSYEKTIEKEFQLQGWKAKCIALIIFIGLTVGAYYFIKFVDHQTLIKQAQRDKESN